MRPPSPFRLILIPTTPKVHRLKPVDCPRSIQTLDGAKRYAKQWGADVGVSGVIDLEQRVAPWPCERFTRIATTDVHNSKTGKWRPV